MTFLNPLLLIALAAAAIPLIIHLFNFRRPRRVEFSSLAFLHELRKSTMQRVRIKQWLLLALRMLTIAFLVTAFARPALTGEMAGSLGGRGRSSTAIVIDNSKSMLLRDDSGSYLEQARTIAATLIDEMESGDEVYLVPSLSSTDAPVAFQNASSARQSLLSLEAADGEMALSQRVRDAAAMLQFSANPNREVYVLSDLQESTFADSLDLVVDSEISVHLIPIGKRTHDNIAISRIDVISRILSAGQVVQMEATLVNYSDRPANDIVVSLYLDGERVSHAATNLGPNETNTIPIAVTPRSTGWLAGQAEIDDSDFRSDDVRPFSIYIPEERNILLVGGRRANTRFIEMALSSAVTGSQIRFLVNRIDETELSRESLGAYNTVVLAGVLDLTSGERAAIGAYVRAGGGLLLFPGDGMVTLDYNALLGELGGGRIEGLSPPPSEGVSMAGFGSVDVQHPLFEGMFESEPGAGAATLEQPDIIRMIYYQPGRGSEQTVIRLTDDHPFLQEIRFELGSAMIFAIAPDAAWSDFPVRGLFVPLLYRSIYYLSAGGSVTGENFFASESAQLRLSGISGDASIQIASENGDVYLPELRRTPGGVLALIGPGYLEAGTYDVVSGGETIRKFVVHPRNTESDMKMYTPDIARSQLAEAIGSSVDMLEISGTESDKIRTQLSSVRTGVELWNVFMMLALFTLLVEMVVEKKWRPEAA